MSRRPTKVEQATTASWEWATPHHQHQLHKACTNIARHYPAVNPDDLYQDALLYMRYATNTTNSQATSGPKCATV